MQQGMVEDIAADVAFRKDVEVICGMEASGSGAPICYHSGAVI